MNDNLDVGGHYINVGGNRVEVDALRVAEAIRAYDPNLEILCLARADSPFEEPFVIAEHCKDGVLRPVLRAWRLDDSVLLRIQAADCKRNDVFGNLLKDEEKTKNEKQRRYADIKENLADQARSVLKTRQSKYTVTDSMTGDTIVFYDDRPAERIHASS